MWGRGVALGSDVIGSLGILATPHGYKNKNKIKNPGFAASSGSVHIHSGESHARAHTNSHAHTPRNSMGATLQGGARKTGLKTVDSVKVLE